MLDVEWAEKWQITYVEDYLKDHEAVSKNDAFWIQNEEFCIQNDEFCRTRWR